MSFSQARPQPSRQPTARSVGTTRTARRQNEDYSLAGPQQSASSRDLHNTHYDEGYRELKPWMDDTAPKDSFSLATTFPHKVRKGMKRRQTNDPNMVESEHKTGTETAPQVPESLDAGSSRTQTKPDPRDPRVWPQSEKDQCEHQTSETMCYYDVADKNS